MIVKFESKAVKAALLHAINGEGHIMGYGDEGPKVPGLLFVKDQGVYLMTNARRTPAEVEAGLGIVFGKGFNPSVDEDWYEAGRGLGGDDFVEVFPFGRKEDQDKMLRQLDQYKWVKLRVTSRSIGLTLSN